MARLRYYPTPADFGMAFGEEVPLRDEEGDPIGELVGRVAVVPSASVSFEVCTSDNYGDVTTDLVVDGNPATTWDTSEDFITLGRGPVLEGPDDHEGPLYLTPDAGTTFYRIEPDSTELYARVEALQSALENLGLGDLINIDLDGLSDGDSIFFNQSTGNFEAGSASGTGTVTQVAGVSPTGGDVVKASLLTALGLSGAEADLSTVKSRVPIVCKPAGGGGFESKSGFTQGIFLGTTQPSSGLSNYDIWLQPESTSGS